MESYRISSLGTVKRIRSSRVSQKQLDIMISFMEANDDLREGKLTASFSKADRKRKWNELTSILNTEGPVWKTAEQWRKSWNDQKAYAKHKAVKIRLLGGNPDYEERLSHTEERILSTLGWALPGDGCRDINESCNMTFQGASFPSQGNSQLCETNLTEYDNGDMEDTSQEKDDALNLFVAKNDYNKLDLSRKLTVITNKLTEQKVHLQQIMESNEKIANACVFIASNSDQRVKEYSEQSALMREILGTMRLQNCIFSDMEKAFKEMISEGGNHSKLSNESPANSQTSPTNPQVHLKILEELNTNRVDVLSGNATLTSDELCYNSQIKVEDAPEDVENYGNKVMKKSASSQPKNTFLKNGNVKHQKTVISEAKFERFLVTEMKSLSRKPKLFIQTKQAILKILGRAHNEMTSAK